MGFYESSRTTLAESNSVVPRNLERIINARGLYAKIAH